jgi:hypothetical protein
MSGSLSKSGRVFIFFTSLLHKILSRYCFVSIVKRDHLLLPNFWPNVLIIFEKNKKIETTMKTQKKCILDIFASFSAFSTLSQKNLNFKGLLNMFDFNASFLKLLIFLVWIDVDIIYFQNTKKKVEGPVWKPSNILSINTVKNVETREEKKFWGPLAEKIWRGEKTLRVRKKTLKTQSFLHH